jgi:hypothetical protein
VAARRFDHNPQKMRSSASTPGAADGTWEETTDKTSSITQTSVIAAMTIAAWSVTS